MRLILSVLILLCASCFQADSPAPSQAPKSSQTPNVAPKAAPKAAPKSLATISPPNNAIDGELAQAPPALLVLGDSLSAAYNIPIDQGWVHLMQARIDAMSCNVRVVNAAISGETTSGGIARLPGLLQRHQPSIVIVELGGNDALRGLSLKDFRQNLEQMIQQSRQAGAKILLAEMRIPSNYGRRFSERFQAVYSELAAAEDVKLLPFLLHNIALSDGLMQADGIHPTADAQPLILDNVWPFLVGWFNCSDSPAAR